jgi:Maltose operon periplasmic protein precursor (MalM)
MAHGTVRSLALALPLMAALAGCQTKSVVMPARLEISTPSCAKAPDMGLASSFTGKKDELVSVVRMGDDAPCVTNAAGQKSSYAVLALPADAQDMIVTVTSKMMGQTILSPRLEIRDDKGALTREIPNEKFAYNGTSVQTQLRQRPGDRYVVILSDPATVGKTVEQIQSIRISSGVMVGMVYVPMNSGAEGRANLVFAHNGEVTTTLVPMPKAGK